MSFAKSMGENIGKKQVKTLVVNIARTGDLIGNKNSKRITIVSKNSQQNNLQTVTNEHDKKIPEERYISPEEKQKIIDDLRLI